MVSSSRLDSLSLRIPCPAQVWGRIQFGGSEKSCTRRYDRFHGSLLHVDIKNGQIWIQHDGTEGGIANELVEMGVPKTDIVLAFHAPYKRGYTGFGTGIESPVLQAA
jgi:hypothetical protein